MITNLGVFEVVLEVSSCLVPSRCHTDAAIDNRSGSASAVCHIIAYDAEILAICANIVGLQAHFKTLDTFIS